jgi:hypothetical protein
MVHCDSASFIVNLNLLILILGENYENEKVVLVYMNNYTCKFRDRAPTTMSIICDVVDEFFIFLR